MIALDTNQLLRAFLLDDTVHSPLSAKLLASAGSGRKLFVPYIAMLEFIWTLGSRKISREKITAVIQNLLHAEGYVVARASIFHQAAVYYAQGRCGFSDYVMVAEAKEAGARSLASFDKQLQTEFPQFVVSPRQLV